MPKGVYQHKKGYHLSKKHKEKLRIANLGKHKVPNEFRKRMREINLGKNNPRWNGGIKTSLRGYVYRLKKDHPYADCNGYIPEHRLVMEKHLRRFLTPKEEPHHINGIKGDNRIKNLMLFKNRAEHMQFEHIGKKLSIETRIKMSIAQYNRQKDNLHKITLGNSLKKG